MSTIEPYSVEFYEEASVELNPSFKFRCQAFPVKGQGLYN